MTRYTVVWIESARDELAALWMNQPLRRSVSKAADEIDGELTVDALTKGRELRDGFRFLAVFPIKIIFRVREEDRMVEVLKVAEV